ncbi:MAG: hypothetical protein HWN81_13595, partial [Candidatus Lokiarchaeota archaeon]|nr:hypothetical protein [Candidatus Lokiarchaeota archaeon]
IFGIVPLFLTFAIVGMIFPYIFWFFTKIRQLEVIEQEKLLEAEQIEQFEEVEEIAKATEQVEVVQVAKTIE